MLGQSLSELAGTSSCFSKHVPKGPPVRTRGLLGQWLSLCYSCNVLQANRSIYFHFNMSLYPMSICRSFPFQSISICRSILSIAITELEEEEEEEEEEEAVMLA